MKGTSSVRRLRLRSFHLRMCSPLCSATSGCSCAYLYACLESEVADRSGMAAWLLSSGVAMCIDTCRFATWCCETHCNGCMTVAWGLCWGGSRSTKPYVFPCKVAAGGDERYLVCAAVAAAVVSSTNVFLLCVLQRVVVPVRICMRVLNLWLQIALEWLHDCCHLIRAGLRRDVATRIVMAASRLLGAAAACVILLTFAARSRK